MLQCEPRPERCSRFDVRHDFGRPVGPAVLGNSDADPNPELVISVPGVVAMTAGDFVLS